MGKKLLGRHALGGGFGGLCLDFGFWISDLEPKNEEDKRKSTLPTGG